VMRRGFQVCRNQLMSEQEMQFVDALQPVVEE
jgi:hypothetical protein